MKFSRRRGRLSDAVGGIYRNRITSYFESLETRQMLTGAPQVISATFDYEHAPPTIKVQFDQDVSASLSRDDLVLTNQTGDAPLSLSNLGDLWISNPGVTYAYDAATNTASWSASEYAFWGDFRADIAAGSVTNSSGQPLTAGVDLKFWLSIGDVNRDRLVGDGDVAVVQAHMNQPGTFTQGDANYDGVVNQSDIDSRIANHWAWDSRQPPDAPRGLTIVSSTSSGNKLAWIDDLNGEGGFRIRRSTDGANFTTLITTAANATEYTDTTAIPGTQYWYHIRGVSNLVNAPTSEWDTAYSDNVTASTALAAPTSLATSSVAAHSATVSWQDNSTTEAGFEVWTSRDGAAFKRYATTAANATFITVQNLAASSAYQFQIRAVSDTAVSAYTTTTSISTPLGDPIVMSSNFQYQEAPLSLDYEFDQNVGASVGLDDINVTNLTTNQTLDQSQASLTYANNIASFKNFPGMRRADGTVVSGNYEAILNGSGIQTAGGASIGADYSHQFFILNGDANFDRVIDLKDWFIWTRHAWGPDVGFGEGDFNYDGSEDLADRYSVSGYWGVTLPPPPTTPNTLTATAATDDPQHKIALNWTEPASGTRDGFRVWRSTDDVNYTQVAQIADPDARGWLDEGLEDGTKYTYRVRSYTDAAGNSASTNKFSAVTVLPEPTDVMATNVNNETNDVEVDWQPGSTHYKNIVVRRYDVVDGVVGTDPVETVVLDGDATSYTFSSTGLMSRNSLAADASTGSDGSAYSAQGTNDDSESAPTSPTQNFDEPTSDWTTAVSADNAPSGSHIKVDWSPTQEYQDPDTGEISHAPGDYGNETVTLSVSGLPRHTWANLTGYVEAHGPPVENPERATFAVTAGDQAMEIGYANFPPDWNGTSYSGYFRGLSVGENDGLKDAFKTESKSINITFTAGNLPEGWTWTPMVWMNTYLPFVSLSGSGTAIEDGSGDGKFTAHRTGSGTVLSEGLEVKVKQAAGTADNMAEEGKDYAALGSIAISSNQNDGSKDVQAIDDPDPEGVEEIYQSVQKSPLYMLAAPPATAPATNSTAAQSSIDDDANVRSIRVVFDDSPSILNGHNAFGYDFNLRIEVTGEHLDKIEQTVTVKSHTSVLGFDGQLWTRDYLLREYNGVDPAVLDSDNNLMMDTGYGTPENQVWIPLTYWDLNNHNGFASTTDNQRLEVAGTLDTEDFRIDDGTRYALLESATRDFDDYFRLAGDHKTWWDHAWGYEWDNGPSWNNDPAVFAAGVSSFVTDKGAAGQGGDHFSTYGIENFPW